MQEYKKFQPTEFDRAGAFLPERAGWLVVPIGRNRDSGPLDLSNWEALESELESKAGEEDENNGWEIHRFGHWACGWYEIFLVKPGTAAMAVAEGVAGRLEDYPVLDEDDFSEREWNDYRESWNDWGAGDFRAALAGGLTGVQAEYALDDVSGDRLRELYESAIPSGEYYISESSGVALNIRTAASNVSRDDIAGLLREVRAAAKSKSKS